MQASKEHSYIAPRDMRAFDFQDVEQFESLRKLGINLDAKTIGKMMAGMDAAGMDAVGQALITSASIATPVQFLQQWLPGFVKTITAARKIDDLVGIMTSGSWDDEQIVQGILERTGNAVPYGDYTNVPLSSWNNNFETRTVIRFEEGLKVGRLEEARASRIQINSAENKREAAGLSLEIERNMIGFYGYNSGANRTYGFLNDPNLPSYVSNASGTPWASATFQQITADLRAGFVALRNQSKDVIDPNKTPITIAIASDCVDFLSVTTDFGESVWDWLKKAYPMARVESAPELSLANGGANVFYMYADMVNDMSTDGGRTWVQVVPAKFQVLGVSQQAKGYEEDYVNATAGCLLKRPYAVVRYTGI